MLRELISDHDKQMMEYFIDSYAIPGSDRRTADIHTILAPWEDAKSEYLYRLLGDMFYSKEVVIQKGIDEIKEDICQKLTGWHSEGEEFYNAFYTFRRSFEAPYWSDRENTPEEIAREKIGRNLYTLMDSNTLATNIYDGDTFEIPVEGDKPLKVNHGCKVSKMLGKIANTFHLEGFEKFRIAHSMCLNEKALKGNLVISIHPMDFMTMSDNDSGWNSCMSWTEYGEYRRGTVEMMNSSMVVCAYLESEDPYELGLDYEWNSKKWRELFIVTPAVIAGVKGYPYWNRDIEKQVIMVLRELAQKNLGWGPYNCEPMLFHPGEEVEFKEFDQKHTFAFYSDAMYCDFYDKHHIIVSHNCPYSYEVNYSGPSECMACGRTDVDFDCEGDLVCYNCDNSIRCCDCGDRFSEGEMYCVDGDYFCEYCYENLPCCDISNEVHVPDLLWEVWLAKPEGVMRGTCINIYEDYVNKLPKGVLKEYRRNYSWYRYISIEDCPDEWIEAFGYDSKEEAMSDDCELIRFDENTDC